MNKELQDKYEKDLEKLFNRIYNDHHWIRVALENRNFTDLKTEVHSIYSKIDALQEIVDEEISRRRRK